MLKPNTSLIVDPLIDISDKVTIPVIKGGHNITRREYFATNFSNSSCHFSVPPPSPNTFLSRRILLKIPVKLEFTGSIPNDDFSTGILTENYDAFRQLPLASLMKTLTVKINGCVISLPVNDVIKPMLMYHKNNKHLNARSCSMSPFMRDQFQDYNNRQKSICGYNEFLDGIFGNGIFKSPCLKNPLGTMTYSNLNTGNPRGAFQYDVFTQSRIGLKVAEIETKLVEELFISPLVFGGGCEDGFVNIKNLDIDIQWDTNLDKIWSHAPSATQGENLAEFKRFLSLTVTLGDTNDKPSVLFEYVTPRYHTPIPKSIQYNYNEIQRYITPIPGNFVFNSEFVTERSNNVQFQVIPRHIYICVRRSPYGLDDREKRVTQPDSYGSIEKLEINWNNNATLFTNASQEQLYDMSRKNGCDLSYQEWSARDLYLYYGADFADGEDLNAKTVNGIGSVICLEMGVDIPLKPGESPGTRGVFNFQCTVSGRWKSHNRNYAGTANAFPLPIEILFITSTPGVFMIQGDKAIKQVGVIDASDVSRAQRNPRLTYKKSKMDIMTGGMDYKNACQCGT